MNWFKAFWKALTAPPVREGEPASTGAGQTRPGVPLSVSPPAESHDLVQIENSLTPRAQTVLALARGEALQFPYHFVGTEHLLLGLISLGQGTAVNVLKKMGLDLETVRTEVARQIGKGPGQRLLGNIPYTPRVKKVLVLAAEEAEAFHHTYIGTGHILLGMLREGEGAAARVLKNLGVNIEQTRAEILRELGVIPPQ